MKPLLFTFSSLILLSLYPLFFLFTLSSSSLVLLICFSHDLLLISAHLLIFSCLILLFFASYAIAFCLSLLSSLLPSNFKFHDFVCMNYCFPVSKSFSLCKGLNEMESFNRVDALWQVARYWKRPVCVGSHVTPCLYLRRAQAQWGWSDLFVGVCVCVWFPPVAWILAAVPQGTI